MARPSGNTDKKLIQAAIELFPQTGFSNLSVREVAKKANVNLGMFHYHFKSKEAFIRKIMQDIYERFFETFQLETAASNDAETRLKNAIKTITKFVRENRKLMIPLVNDVLLGHHEVQKFLAQNMQRHMKIFLAIIKDCQKQGVIEKYPLTIVLPFLLGNQAAPSIIANLLEKTRIPLPFALAKTLLIPKFLSDKEIDLRIDLTLKALKVEKKQVASRRKRV